MIAIRGATTIEFDTVEEIKKNTIELFSEIITKNNISLKDIKTIIFSCTKDITKDYPGKYVREYFQLNNTAIMHFNEMYVENSLEKCIRILILLDNCVNSDIEYVYLKKARSLRKDLFND